MHGATEERVRAFRAMGTDCAVRVAARPDLGDPLLDEAEALVEALEARWSRFRPESELSRLNRHAGAPVLTSGDTATLVALAVDAFHATGGRFDPTVHDALVAAGYDRSFDDLAPGGADRLASPAPGVDRVEVDPAPGLVHLPAGCHLDLGGIGKGRAADLVLDRLLALGADGACVDLGGDVRVGGAPAGGGAWVVAVEDPFDAGTDLARVALDAGAVTTSARTRRRWRTAAGAEAHHLIDPATGRPAASGLAAVTVLAASAAWGEVHAKAALVAGPTHGRRLLEDAGLCGLLVTDGGAVVPAGPIGDFVLDAPRCAVGGGAA